MAGLAFKDEVLDAQLLRLLGTATYGGAEVGECMSVARAVKGTDLDSWFEAWSRMAQAVASIGEQQQAAGHIQSAWLAYQRACGYHRTAGVMLMGVPLDARLVDANARQTEMFRRATALMRPAPEIVEIPFEGVSLPGYFFAAAADGRARATVILTGGYDGTAEELYFANGAAALDRGYNVLAFDGPGQGATLIQRGLPLRADWESVVAAVLDHALARPDVDARRVALIGLSLGAHLAARAASAEQRLAACVADCGAYDLDEAFLARLPRPLAGGFARGRRRTRAAVAELMSVLMRRPTAGWAIRRGLLAHGVREPLEMVDALREFTLSGRAQHIACPTWVCSAQDDDIGASAPQLVEQLTCEKVYVRFTRAEGAGDHCEAGARSLYHARSFGWLDELLRPREVA